MSDDFPPSYTPSDELQAVSAALDGTATVDERALIDGSPELGRLLAELEGARHSMIDVAVPHQAREAGIAAALAAFDELHAASAPIATSTVVPTNVIALQRRKRLHRAITAAAAAVVLVVVGVAAFASRDGNDNDDTATFATAESGATKIEAAPDAAAEAPAEADNAAPMAAADTQAADAIDQSSGGTAAPAVTAAAPSTIGEIPGPGEVAPSIADEESLARYVADAPTETASDPCIPAGDDNLGDITYQGAPSVVGRHPDTGQVLVYDTADCAVLATLPS